MISPTQTSVKHFSVELLNEIKTRALQAKRELPQPWIAAFDADGTIWDIDVGHLVFLQQIKEGLLFQPPQDPWQHYINLKKQDHRIAYLWLAQVLQQHRIEDIQKFNAQFIKSLNIPYFVDMKNLINWLRSEDFEVYVVTASVKWSVEPAAQHIFDIKPENVLGIQTEVKNGKISNEQLGEITWKEGKAKQLLKQSNGIRPILCCGNTIGDLALIELASHVQLAVMSQGPGGDIYETEKQLHDIAVARGYLTHSFQ